METMKLESYMEEFPFLRSTRDCTFTELNDKVEYLTIQIKRLDAEILEQIPTVYYWNGSAGVTEEEEIIDFISKAGETIENAVKSSGESGSNYAHSSTSSWCGQSIIDAIYEQKVADDIKYVVMYKDSYRSWDSSGDCNYVEIIIYKLPKNVTIKELIKHKKQQIIEKIKGQTNF